jgi:hypothetical protein
MRSMMVTICNCILIMCTRTLKSTSLPTCWLLAPAFAFASLGIGTCSSSALLLVLALTLLASLLAL